MIVSLSAETVGRASVVSVLKCCYGKESIPCVAGVEVTCEFNSHS